MRQVINRAKAFAEGCQEGIEAKDKQLMQEEYKDEQSRERPQIKRVGQIDDNLKFGRRKKTAQLFK